MTTLQNQMRKAIYESPQRDVLLDSDVDAWIEAVIRLYPDRALWHVARLYGFGGSEVGALCNARCGKRNFFVSSKQLIAGKLCKAIPFGGDTHTRRGEALEKTVQSLFEEKLTSSGLSFTNLSSIQRFHLEEEANPMFEWMRSTLDGLYEIDLQDGSSEVWLVDFKSPSVGVMTHYKDDLNKISKKTENLDSVFNFTIDSQANRIARFVDSKTEIDSYIQQLMHYKTDAFLKDVSVSRTVLAIFDYQIGDVQIIDIEKDDLAVDDIIQSSEFFWDNYVMTGTLPPEEGREKVDVDDKLDFLASDFEDFVQIRHSMRSLNNLLTVTKRKIESRLEPFKLQDNKVIEAQGVQIKSNHVILEDAVADRLVELGLTDLEISELRVPGKYCMRTLKKTAHHLEINLEKFIQAVKSKDSETVKSTFSALTELFNCMPRKEDGAFDEKKLKEKLLSCGDDPNVFITNELNIGETRKSSSDLDRIRSVVDDKMIEIQKILLKENNLEKDYRR
jgi:hypothetical protein